MSARNGSTQQIPLSPGAELPTLTRQVTQDLIDGWAELSGDFNPLHTDVEYARSTRFGGTIAHGHISLCWLLEMLFGVAGDSWLTTGSLRNVTFLAPVRPGATMAVGGVVTDVDEQHVNCEVWVSDAATQAECVRGRAVFVTPKAS